jgi:hypothetical protein
MTSRTRAKNGDWFARKGIPADIRQAYKLAHGVSREERFRRPSSLSQNAAKAELRDWDATISQRIDSLRASVANESVHLTPRQIGALSGTWYGWFIAQHDDDPGKPEDWDSRMDSLESVYDRFDASPVRDENEALPRLSVAMSRLSWLSLERSKLS